MTPSMKWAGALPALALCVFVGQAAIAAETFEGKVVGVSDGDTVTVLRNGHDQVRIRLSGIDAPELHQPLGQQAKGLVQLGRVDAAEANTDLVVSVAQDSDRVAVTHPHNLPVERLCGDRGLADKDAERERRQDAGPLHRWCHGLLDALFEPERLERFRDAVLVDVPQLLEDRSVLGLKPGLVLSSVRRDPGAEALQLVRVPRAEEGDDLLELL